MKLERYMPLLAIVATAAAAACGGGEPAETPEGGSQPAQPAATSPPSGGGLPAPPTGPLTMPDWYVIDNDAQTVQVTLTAGETPVQNYWNYNGATNGDLAITVPQGYTVTLTQVNEDPNMAHSVGILELPNSFAMPPQPNPVFEGAISQNPTSMVEATMPGESESIEFVASDAGSYGLVCLIPGHAAVGMWLYFNVSADGEAGVRAR